MFGEFYGSMEEVTSNETVEWVFTHVKDAAGIHFSSFEEKDQPTDAEAEAIAAGAPTMRSNWRPDAEWRAENLVPAKPLGERGIFIIDEHNRRIPLTE